MFRNGESTSCVISYSYNKNTTMIGFTCKCMPTHVTSRGNPLMRLMYYASLSTRINDDKFFHVFSFWLFMHAA